MTKKSDTRPALAISFDASDLEQLRRISRTENRSLASFVRYATKRWLGTPEAQVLLKRAAATEEALANLGPAQGFGYDDEVAAEYQSPLATMGDLAKARGWDGIRLNMRGPKPVATEPKVADTKATDAKPPEEEKP